MSAGAAGAGVPHQYVGLVRGINVGGSNRITMADFRAVFEGLGFSEVKTLLQSGNVVFASPRELGAADVVSIERGFEAAAGFRASFVVLSVAQFLAVLAADPLQVGTDPSRRVVTFLPQTPDARPTPAPAAGAEPPDLELPHLELPDAAAIAPEVFALGPHAVYSWHPDGISKSRVHSAWWKQLGPAYTARNLNTTTKLAALLAARAS